MCIMSCLKVRQEAKLSIYLSVYLSIYLSIYRPKTCRLLALACVCSSRLTGQFEIGAIKVLCVDLFIWCECALSWSGSIVRTFCLCVLQMMILQQTRCPLFMRSLIIFNYLEAGEGTADWKVLYEKRCSADFVRRTTHRVLVASSKLLQPFCQILLRCCTTSNSWFETRTSLTIINYNDFKTFA